VPREIPVALTTQSWGGVPYYESSARRNVNVANVFEDVLRQIIRQRSVAEENGRRERESRKASRRGRGCVIL